jgi:hypothetical protein
MTLERLEDIPTPFAPLMDNSSMLTSYFSSNFSAMVPRLLL